MVGSGAVQGKGRRASRRLVAHRGDDGDRQGHRDRLRQDQDGPRSLNGRIVVITGKIVARQPMPVRELAKHERGRSKARGNPDVAGIVHRVRRVQERGIAQEPGREIPIPIPGTRMRGVIRRIDRRYILQLQSLLDAIF